MKKNEQPNHKLLAENKLEYILATTTKTKQKQQANKLHRQIVYIFIRLRIFSGRFCLPKQS